MNNMPQALNAQVLISGKGTNALNIVHKVQQGALPGLTISQALCNNPSAPGIQMLRELGLPTKLVNHKDFDDRAHFELALTNAINQQPCDLLILAGFMRILSAEFVSRFAGKMVNIHPSLLPAHKGLHTHQRALDAGDKIHGVSVHLVTPDLDAGPVIGQAVLQVGDEKCARTLEQRIQQMEYWLYPQCLGLIASGGVKLMSDSVSVQAHQMDKPNSAGVYTWTEEYILSQRANQVESFNGSSPLPLLGYQD